MKRVISRLHRALMLVLAVMPLGSLLFRALTSSFWLGPVWLVAQTVIAAMFTLLPAYIGTYREYDLITHEGGAGLDPNPDRETRHQLVREGRRFPLRLAVDLVLLAAELALLLLLPGSLFQGASLARHLGFSAAMLVLMLFAMRDIAVMQCPWTDIPGVLVGAISYFILAIYLRFANTPAPELNTLISVCAVIYLFFGALTLNSQSIAQSMAAHLGEVRRPPRQIGRRNRNIVLIFAGAVTMVSLLSPIRTFVLWAFAQAGAGIKWIFASLRALFGGGGDAPEELPMDVMAGMGGMEQGAEEAVEAAQSSIFGDILVYLFLGVMAVGFLWFLFDKIRSLVNKLTKWFERFTLSVNEGFYDEREQLMSAEEVRDQLRKRFRDRMRALLTRETPWEQLDGRMRARRLYRDYIKRRARRLYHPRNKTARELIYESEAKNPAAFAEAYERARYSPHEVEAEAVDKMKKDLRL